ncbi:hypothetical protein, partial [Methylomonas koyamae]|uniref:hypothetical protein n=1 Tax=Methylomonas koyamae TaxID=702114 RepID=UPI000A883791
MSYPGELSFSKSLELEILKQQARSAIELEQAEAVYKLPGHIGDRLSRLTAVTSGIDDADPAVKAAREVAEPLRRGF